MQIMRDDTIEAMVNTLLRLYKESHHPFPYEGCRAILRQASSEYEHLISDLDRYFSDIAGYSSWGKNILKWSNEKIEEVIKKLSPTFFEKHHEYKPLESMITEPSTPDLYTDLALYEKMRHVLLKLLCMILSERESDLVGKSAIKPQEY